MKIRASIVLSIAFILAFMSNVFADDVDNVANRAYCNPYDIELKKSVIRINDKESFNGSGVVLAQGMVLTAYHVVDEIPKENLYIDVEGELRKAVLVRFDVKLDLALLYVDTKGLDSIPLGEHTLIRGDYVWAVGFAAGGPLRSSLGTIQYKQGPDYISDNYVRRGSSGGALLYCNKRRASLVGIVLALYEETYGGVFSNAGVAKSVGLKDILDFLLRKHDNQASPDKEDNKNN